MLRLLRVMTSGPFGTVRHWRYDRLGEIIEIVTIPGRKGSADVIHAGHLSKVTSQCRNAGVASSAQRRRPEGSGPKLAT
jgi:hypothetical protein